MPFVGEFALLPPGCIGTGAGSASASGAVVSAGGDWSSWPRGSGPSVPLGESGAGGAVTAATGACGGDGAGGGGGLRQ